MKRILITGMSATGKSSVVAELSARGYAAVDLDACSSAGKIGEWLWDEAAVTAMLDESSRDPLFLSGCADNQWKFYERFSAIILLSAPEHVMVERVRTRTTNDFGKTPEQLAKILADRRQYEPLLRRRADHEIDTSRPLSDVTDELLHFVARAEHLAT